MPATDHGVAAMADRGLDLSAPREPPDGRATCSRRADLVIAMAREHVREAAVLVPDALAQDLHPQGAGPRRRRRSGRAAPTSRSTPGSAASPPHARPARWSAWATTTQLDVADPVGRGRGRLRGHRRPARPPARPTVVDLAFPARTPRRRSSAREGRHRSRPRRRATSRRTSSRSSSALGHEPIDLGTHSTESVDYPPICAAVGRAVVAGEADRGIVLGGSGPGRADRRQQGARRAGRAVQRSLHGPPEPRAQRRQRARDGRPHRRRGPRHRDPRAVAHHPVRRRPPRAPRRPDRRHREPRRRR